MFLWFYMHTLYVQRRMIVSEDKAHRRIFKSTRDTI